MEFYLLNDSLSVVGTLEGITYAEVRRRFFAPGEITVKTADKLALPKTAKYIYDAENDVYAVIERLSYPAYGGSLVSGRSVECLFERQLVKRHGYLNGSVESAVRVALTSFAVSNGAFPRLAVGDVSGLPESAVTFFDWVSLSEWLYSTLGRYGASYRLDAPGADSFFTVSVVFGRDLTSRSGGKTVLIREEDGSLDDASFSVDETDYSNVICVVGNDGRYVTLPENLPEGLDRREGVIMAKDIYPSSFETEAAYLDALRKRGESRIKSFSERITFTGSARGDGAYVFGRDYDLGDICEIETKSGVTLALRVTSVTNVYEHGIKRTEVRFGSDISSDAVISEE